MPDDAEGKTLSAAAILERHVQKLELLLHPAGAGASAQEPHLRPWDFVLQCCAASIERRLTAEQVLPADAPRMQTTPRLSKASTTMAQPAK